MKAFVYKCKGCNFRKIYFHGRPIAGLLADDHDEFTDTKICYPTKISDFEIKEIDLEDDFEINYDNYIKLINKE